MKYQIITRSQTRQYMRRFAPHIPMVEGIIVNEIMKGTIYGETECDLIKIMFYADILERLKPGVRRWGQSLASKYPID